MNKILILNLTFFDSFLNFREILTNRAELNFSKEISDISLEFIPKFYSNIIDDMVFNCDNNM